MALEPQTRVVNLRKEQYDVYCGRGSIYGNPFVIGRDGNRTEIIEKYRAWVVKQPHILSTLPHLKGKRLGCYCKPKACHCDILVELINGADTPS